MCKDFKDYKLNPSFSSLFSGNNICLLFKVVGLYSVWNFDSFFSSQLSTNEGSGPRQLYVSVIPWIFWRSNDSGFFQGLAQKHYVRAMDGSYFLGPNSPTQITQTTKVQALSAFALKLQYPAMPSYQCVCFEYPWHVN